MAHRDSALPWVLLVILSAPTRHGLTRRAMSELICDDSRTDMLMSHLCVVLTSAAVVKSSSGNGASGQTIHVRVCTLAPLRP